MNDGALNLVQAAGKIHRRGMLDLHIHLNASPFILIDSLIDPLASWRIWLIRLKYNYQMKWVCMMRICDVEEQTFQKMSSLKPLVYIFKAGEP